MLVKKPFRLAYILFFALVLPWQVQSQCSQIVDLNTWSRAATTTSGNWVVNAAGTSVEQTINGQPSFFVSPQEFINVRMRGTFRTTNTDDDFMGFVFGWQDPTLISGTTWDFDGYLFDWSQVPHFNANAGRYLVRLDGVMNQGGGSWWNHAPTPQFSIVDSDIGAGTGWTRNVSYNFELTYLTDRIVIVINNDTFFDVAGCFQPGKFGFYNYSQGNVFYSNFNYDILPDFQVASTNVCDSDSAQFFYINDTCNTLAGAPSSVNSFSWNFGDGNTSTAINPAHLYSSPGTYNVTLTVTDIFNCATSVNQSVTINPLPAPPTASNNGPLCENSTLTLLSNGSSPGGTFSWTGPNGYTSTQQNPSIPAAQNNASGTYSVVFTDANGCESTPTNTAATVHPTPLAPTAGSNGPVCEDSTINFTAAGQAGASFTWNGPNGFSSSTANPSINNPSTAASGTYNVFSTINGCPGPATAVSVTVNPTPTVAIAGTQQICNGQTTTLSASGANSYAWSNGAASPNTTVAPTDDSTFTVVGVSGAGCPSLPVSATVIVDTVPVVDLGNNMTVCDGVTLDAGPVGHIFSWSTSATTQTIPVSSSGTYSVTVTDSNNCSGTDAVTVTVNNTIPVNLGANQNVCPGDSVLIVPNPNPFASYNWSTGSTANSIYASVQGNYSVNVLDANGCPSSDTIFLNVYPTPTVNISGTNTICVGETSTLTATGAATYAWNTGANSPAITVAPLVDSTYTVIGTSSVGCPSAPTTYTVIVDTLPTVNLGADTTVCDGLTLDAGTSGSNYTWSTSATSQTIPVTTSGTYFVTISNSATCQNSDTINVVVNNTVSPDLGPDQDICPGTTTTLVSNPNNFSVYNWSTSATTSSITVGTTGNYVLNTQDQNGCPSTDTVFVNVYALLAGNAGADTLVCNGDIATFDASSWAGATYAWLPGGQTTPSISTGAAGIYTVSIDDGNGCIYGDTVELTVDTPPTISLATSDSTRCVGDPITFTVSPAGVATYDFFNGGNNIGSGASETLTTTALLAGNSINAIATTVNGCATAASNAIAINILDRPTGTTFADTVCEGFPTTLNLNPGPNLNATWTGTGGLSGNGNTLSYIYPSAGNYSYSIVLDNGFCDTTINGTVFVRAEPGPVNVSDTIACLGEDALLNASGSGGSLEWYDASTNGNLVTTGGSLTVPNAVLSDTFYVQEIITGCVGPLTPILLEVVDNPVAGFLASPDTSIILNIPQSEVQFVNVSTGANSYFWDFGDGNTTTNISPIYSYDTPGDYMVTLIAVTSANCQDTITIGPFEVRDFEGFSAPNGFSPNGDGDNDTWIVDDLFFYPNNTVQIFNRWGDSVFEAERYQSNWDGTRNGEPLPEGTYYYVIDLGNGSDPVKGFIVLFR